MQKINKTEAAILSTKYKKWLDKLNEDGKTHDGQYRYYYPDVVFNLYRIQKGVCAYTELNICIPDLYADTNWVDGRHKTSQTADYNKKDHLGELEHFDPKDKIEKYWNWDNLFMVHSSINRWKSGSNIVPYLKPDHEEYTPEKYFDYDTETNRFQPNTDITDQKMIEEIQYMIDHVLFLNHGVVKNERRDYIEVLKGKIDRGERYTIDRFYTSVKWVLGLS